MALKKILFNRLSIGMIPLSYRESLTYEEQLLWLQKNLNEIIEVVNTLQEKFESIDINFDEIQREIDEINSTIEDMQNAINSKASKEELNIAIDNLNTSIRELINEEYGVLKEYVDTQDENLQYQIDNFDVRNVQVYDPTTGILSPIQVVINNIYDQTRDDGITAGEFDTLELTASEYDGKELTAFEFDQHAKTLLTE